MKKVIIQFKEPINERNYEIYYKEIPKILVRVYFKILVKKKCWDIEIIDKNYSKNDKKLNFFERIYEFICIFKIAMIQYLQEDCMRIKIIQKYNSLVLNREMVVGEEIDTDNERAKILINKGFAEPVINNLSPEVKYEDNETIDVLLEKPRKRMRRK